MARGHEDWGINTSAYGAFEVDIAELAARLGSPHVFTRIGKVIFIDRFEDNLTKYEVSTGGANDDILLTYANCYNGFGCAKFRILSGGSGGNSLVKKFPAIPTTRIGIEVMHTFGTGGQYFLMGFNVHDGDDLHLGRIRIGNADNAISYFDEDGNWVEFITNPAFPINDSQFFQMKLVLDIENNNYVKFIYNGVTHSLADIPVRTIASGTSTPYYELFMRQDQFSSVEPDMYVDNVIITIDEP